MTPLKIAASAALIPQITSPRALVSLEHTDFTDIAAVVLTHADASMGMLSLLNHSGFNLPVFVAGGPLSPDLQQKGVRGIYQPDDAGHQALEEAACEYQQTLLPRFSIR